MSTPVPQMTRKWRRELERRLKNNLVVHEYQWHMRWDGDLFEWERWWAQLQPRIAAAGYDLRPRYHPGWTPSWLGIVGLWRNPMDCPDWTEMIKENIMDAARSSDGSAIVLKRQKLTEPFNELYASRVFCTEEVARDPRNHCVRLLDIIYLEGQTVPEALLVYPALLPCDICPFETVEEAVDFFKQLFEGLDFMHEHNVAHRDICPGNIMIYAPEMFPQGTHPVHPHETPTTRRLSPYRPRRSVRCRYYFIDFGHATHFASVEDRRPVFGGRGQYKEPPELDGTPFDGFALDLWCMGHLITTQFLEKQNGDRLAFMRPLVESALRVSPRERPTAREALSSLEYAVFALTDDEKHAPLQDPAHPRVPDVEVPSLLARLFGGGKRTQAPWRAPLFE